jgi:hypothetical protein
MEIGAAGAATGNTVVKEGTRDEAGVFFRTFRRTKRAQTRPDSCYRFATTLSRTNENQPDKSATDFA